MHPRDRLGDVVILTMAHFPARGELDALQLGMIDGTPTMARHAREAGDDPHTFTVGPVQIEIVGRVPGGAPAGRRRHRGPGRPRPHVHRPHAGLRAAPRHDACRPRADLGSEPHAAVGHLQRHLHPRGARPPGGRLVGPARPLVGHPRPRPLPVLDVAGDPAPRRDARGVALGAHQRGAHLHRRLLRPGRRQPADPGGRLPARPRVGRRRRRGGELRPRRRRGRRHQPGTSTSRWRAAGRSASTPPAAGRSATATSAAGSARSRSSPTTGAVVPVSTSSPAPTTTATSPSRRAERLPPNG